MTKTKTYYVGRVRDTGASPKEDGKAFRVRTTSNPAGQFSMRKTAQAAIDAALKNDHDLVSAGVQTEKIAASDDAPIDKWLVGNVVAINKVPTKYRSGYGRMLQAAANMAREYGHALQVNESFRTLKQQQYFWDLYKNHGGAIAAKPGTSNHEFGLALDIPNLWSDKKLAKLAKKYGFAPEAGEAWHGHFVA